MRDILPSGSKKGSQEFNDAFIEAAKMTSNEWIDEAEEDNSDIGEPPPLISDDEDIQTLYKPTRAAFVAFNMMAHDDEDSDREPPPLTSDDDEESDWSYTEREEVVEVD